MGEFLIPPLMDFTVPANSAPWVAQAHTQVQINAIVVFMFCFLIRKGMTQRHFQVGRDWLFRSAFVHREFLSLDGLLLWVF